MDRTLSVTSARQQLLKLTKSVRRRMDRIVLTNKGEAEAVLLSVGEYNSLKAAAELAMHPEVGRATVLGFEQIRKGEGKTLEEVFPSKTANAMLPESLSSGKGIWKTIMESFQEPTRIPNEAGIYALFLKPKAALPSINVSGNGLLYIGMTESSLVIRDHFGHRNSGFSTLRRSLGALLKKDLQLKAFPRASGPSRKNVINFRFQNSGEEALTAWMKQNLLAGFACVKGDVRAVERQLILQHEPPLNLTGWHNPQRVYLKSLRKICQSEAFGQQSHREP